MPLFFFTENAWYQLVATDNRGVGASVVLAQDQQVTSGVLVPREDGHPVARMLREDQADKAAKEEKDLLLIDTGGLDPDVYAFLAETFLKHAATLIKSGENTVALTKSVLDLWGFINA